MKYVPFDPSLSAALDIMYYEFEIARKFPTKANKERYRAALEKVISIAEENGNGLLYTPSYRAHRSFVKQRRRINRKYGFYAEMEYWRHMISQHGNIRSLLAPDEKAA